MLIVSHHINSSMWDFSNTIHTCNLIISFLGVSSLLGLHPLNSCIFMQQLISSWISNTYHHLNLSLMDEDPLSIFLYWTMKVVIKVALLCYIPHIRKLHWSQDFVFKIFTKHRNRLGAHQSTIESNTNYWEHAIEV